MGISRRTTGANLLNYLIQTNILEKMDIKYIQRRDYKGPEIDSASFQDKQAWIFVLSYHHNGQTMTFSQCAKNKKKAVELTMKLADIHLSEIIQYT